MSSTLDVSIIIPCFNDGATIWDAVASARSEHPGEIIVVNDGSDDTGTLEALRGLSASNVTVIHQSNVGPAGARTRGLRAATREFVFNLDADDMFVPGALGSLVSALDADPGLAAAWGDHELFGAAQRRCVPRGRALDPWRITFVNEVGMSALFRRTELIDIGGWTSSDLYEDWDLWMDMAERGLRGTNIGSSAIRYRTTSAPRRTDAATKQHAQTRRRMRRRHRDLFARRRESRRQSPSRRSLKVAWTAIDAVPMPGAPRRYLLHAALLVCEPQARPRK